MKVVEVDGRWRIPYSEIDCCPAVEGLNKWRYARVSPTQEEELERQLDALRE